jgi:hypothetical protein
MSINSLALSHAVEVHAFDTVVFAFITGEIKPKQATKKLGYVKQNSHQWKMAL